MLLHYIFKSDVKPGDHLYRWRSFSKLQDIAVKDDDEASGISVVVSTGLNGFRLVTLREFKGKGVLRRALYDQSNSYLHPMKLSGTSFVEKKIPADEVVRNALLLLDSNNTNRECLKQLVGHGAGNFARLCCTMNYEQWRNHLQTDGCNPSSVNNTDQTSGFNSTSLPNKYEMEDKQCCPICMDRLCDVAFGCGHLTCSECAQALDICHICRRDIQQKIPIFWPI